MRRKTLSLLLGSALLCLPAAARADALEDVLANYYAAIGGVDAWEAVESCRMSGQMMMPMGMEAPYTITFVRPLKTRLEFSVQGMTGVQVYDGEKAWAVLPFLGSSDPQPMPAEQAKIMKEQADFSGPLVGWEAKGHQVELVGMESVEGTEAYHLKVTLESGDIRHFFLDSESYLPFRLEMTTDIQGTEMEIETLFSDFRKVGDLVMAHSIESRPQGAPEGQVLTMDTIELDIEISDDLFALPGAEDEDEREESEAAE